MKKKTLALAMLLLLAFTGCQKDTAGEKEKQTDETTPEIVLVDDGSGYTPPDVTYDGYNFRAIVRGFYKWACQDIFSEGYTGEGINDAVFTRNAYVEDLLDIEITQQAIETDAGLYNTIGRSVRAGDDAFDMMWVGSAYITQLAMDGVLTNLNSIESLDLSYDWWDQRAVENMTLDDAIFFTTGDMSIISNQATYVITFNKSLTEDYGLENPYELVNNNQWTVDKFGQMAESLYEDLNGNGQYDADDRYGFMTYNADNMGFLLSAGGSIAKVENNTLTTGYNTEPVIDMLTKLAAIKNQRSTFYFPDDDTATRMFTEGRTLFSFRTLINLGTYRDMETNYGILPTPKLNEQQEDFYCGVHAHGLSLIGTPITAQDSERTGVILQTMGQKSKQVLTPAFYDKTLKGKYFQDEESGAMLDIIFDSRVYDIGYFCNWGGVYDQLNNLSTSGGDSFASTFASVSKKVQSDMEKTVAAFGDVEITAQSILRDVEEKKAQQITEDDMEENDYVIGTLAAASGELDPANTTRISMEAYIPLRQLKEVRIDSGYELTWLAYGADKTYIGNGNPEKKGSWLGDGNPFTAEEILTAHPEAVYARFALRKADGSELKLSDVEASGVTVILAGQNYKQGTIAAASGQFGPSTTRVMLDDYLPLTAVREVAVGEGYELTWLSYDADKKYVGNGNPNYSGVWLPSGESILAQTIFETYPEAAYYRFALRKTDGSDVTLEDVALSGVTLISSGKIVEIGEPAAAEDKEANSAETGDSFMENYPNYVMGSIAAATGESTDSTTRFRTDGYLKLDQITEVNIGADYEITWLVYDKDKKYLGNGNPEMKGNWIGVGVSFTSEALLAAYPDGVYVRFAVRKPDNSELTADDIAASAVEAVHSNTGIKVGTIAAASGQFGESNTRLMMDEYLPVSGVKEVKIGAGYELTWLAYDENKAYIGNGNPAMSGNWIGEGNSFTAQQILDNYDNAAYIRFALRKTDNSEVTMEELAASGLKIVVSDTGKAAESALIKPDYAIGTIAAASGQSGDSTTRFRTESYLPLDKITEVTINSGYTLTWLAYDKDQNYLGNGNPEKKGNWLGDGVPVTAEQILALHPDAVYIRFAVKRMDDGEINADTDFAAADIGIGLNIADYVMGTIAAKDGTSGDSTTRFRMDNTVLLKQVEKVTIGEGYELTWLAYDAKGAYLGNGNPAMSGNWLGNGASFTAADILAYAPDAVSFRFAVRKTDNSEVTMDDVKTSGVKLICSDGIQQYVYTGKSLGTNNLMSYTHEWTAVSGQDGAIWGDYLFRFDSVGGCTVYSIPEQKQVSAFKLDKSDILSPHSNAVCFGAEYYADGDEFPLLYSNIYNNYAKADDRLEGVCCVYRLTRDGDAFSSQLVQVIEIGFTEDLDLWKSLENNGDVRSYGNFTVDRDNSKLYAFVMRDKEKVTRYFEFDLPKLADGTMNETWGVNVVALTADKILKQFDSEYSNFVQGACFHDGKIYSVEGFSGADNAPKMQIIDPAAGEQYAAIDLWNIGLKIEPEFVDFYEGTLYYVDASGKVYTFLFQ